MEIDFEDDRKKELSEKQKRYYDNTRDMEPSKSLERVIKDLKPGNALDLGFGAGRDSRLLLNNGWNVIAVDKFPCKEYLLNGLTIQEQSRLKIVEKSFEKLELPKNYFDLVNADYSLHCCSQENLPKVFQEIRDAIKPGGYFIGTLLGEKDSWNGEVKSYSFVKKENIDDLLTGFEINVKEFYNPDGKTSGSGKDKIWHVYNIVAKKIYI